MDIAHLNAVMRSRALIYDIGNLWCWSRARKFTLKTFDRVQTIMTSLHGHAFDPDSDPNFDFSALNRMRNVANSH